MAWLTFATRTSPNPMSTLDTQFGNVAQWSTIDTTASGTNVITLTPSLSGYTAAAYANYVTYRFVAANSNSGATTLKVGALAAINVYRQDGTTQATTGDIIAGQAYSVTYNSALNSAAGGWYITPIGSTPSALPDPVTVPHGGTGLVTLTTAYAVLCAGTTATANVQPLSALGATGTVLTSNGASALPSFQAAGGGSLIWLAKLTASNSASLTDTTHITSTYNAYMFVFTNIRPATNQAQLQLQVSTNGGGAYLNSSYVTYLDTLRNIAALAATGSTPTTCVGMSAASSVPTNANGISNSANYGLNGVAHMYNPSGGSTRTQINAMTSYIDGNGAQYDVCFSGGLQDTGNTAVNAVKFLCDSGNITSGTIDIYGLKQS